MYKESRLYTEKKALQMVRSFPALTDSFGCLPHSLGLFEESRCPPRRRSAFYCSNSVLLRALPQAANAFAKATDVLPLGLGAKAILMFGEQDKLTMLLAALPGPLSNVILREKVQARASISTDGDLSQLPFETVPRATAN